MGAMEGMGKLTLPVAFAPWTAGDFALNLAMWRAMMPGMMLPSAAPMILIFAAINRHKRQRGQPFVPTVGFTSGYLIAWGLFGLVATLADWGLERAALISAMTARLTPLLGAIVVIAFGIYQLTPLKRLPDALPLTLRFRSRERPQREPYGWVGSRALSFRLLLVWMALLFAAGIMRPL